MTQEDTLTLAEAMQRGMAAHQAGDLNAAFELYNAVLSTKPDHFDALHLMGVLFVQAGHAREGAEVIAKAVSLAPGNAAAHANLGNALMEMRQPADALASYDRALALQANNPKAYSNRGNALMELGRYTEASAAYDNALTQKSDYAEAHYGRGVARAALGDQAGALESLDRAAALRPGHAETHYHRGVAQWAMGQSAQSIESYDKALELNPNFAAVYLQRGNAFLDLGRYEESLAAYDRAFALAPDMHEAKLGRGNVLFATKQYDAALAAYQEALALTADYAEAWEGKAKVLWNTGRGKEAIAAFEKHLELSVPASEPRRAAVIELAKSLFAFDAIPEIYGSEAEIEAARAEAKRILASIHQQIDALPSPTPAAVTKALFSLTGFYTAYQQKNDVDLMTSLSGAVSRMLNAGANTGVPYIKNASGRIRIGIASEFLRHHNGARWAYDWFSQLPKQDYEFFCYAFHAMNDKVTAKFAQLGPLRRHTFTPATYEAAIASIRSDHLDFLMLPDIGMTPSSRILSQYRMAPVQFTAWGHPVTSGSANIDFYLSSDLMEPKDADAHYSERLVRLPNLALYLEPDEYAAEPDADFGFPADRVIYGSLQSLFKYLPQYDGIYPAIAKRVPNALFVFIEGDPAYMTAALKTRLATAFAREGLEAEKYVRFLPRMSAPRFTALLGNIRANIDSIGWTGGNTTVQTLQMECPVVTLPGAFMRGRHTYAMLKRIGADELIASSQEDFVDKLARLGADDAFHAAMKAKLAAGKANLYRDRDFIAGLDGFFKAEFEKLS